LAGRAVVVAQVQTQIEGRALIADLGAELVQMLAGMPLVLLQLLEPEHQAYLQPNVD